MRAKLCIFNYLFILALFFTTADHAIAATTVSPATAKQHSATSWKTIPEDSTSWRREPFKTPDTLKLSPGVQTKQGSLDLALQGILKSNKHYYAIVNGRTVKTGDRIDGWTITEISRYRVIVRQENEKQIFDIYQGRIDRGSR